MTHTVADVCKALRIMALHINAEQGLYAIAADLLEAQERVVKCADDLIFCIDIDVSICKVRLDSALHALSEKTR